MIGEVQEMVSDRVEQLKLSWQRFYETVARPARCLHCAHRRVNWNGSRTRTASVKSGRQVVYVRDIHLRRVKCAACERSWTLHPPGMTPRRHFQLCVIADGAARYLFDVDESLARIAAAIGCCRRTVSRWLDWIAGLIDPAELAGLVVHHADAVILAAVRPVADLTRKALSEGRRQLLCRAAQVLGQLEVLAMAWGLEPPGLASVVEAVVGGRDGLTTYRAPALPEFARRPGWRPGGTLPAHERQGAQTRG
jgi:hypothetical protein